MNSQETIILMMAQKLRSCDEQEMRKLCAETGQASPDDIYQTLDRWSKLDPATQQKIMGLIKTKNVREEVHMLKTHINRLMETPKRRTEEDKEAGQ
jgi:hypothetical protein